MTNPETVRNRSDRSRAIQLPNGISKVFVAMGVGSVVGLIVFSVALGLTLAGLFTLPKIGGLSNVSSMIVASLLCIVFAFVVYSRSVAAQIAADAERSIQQLKVTNKNLASNIGQVESSLAKLASINPRSKNILSYAEISELERVSTHLDVVLLSLKYEFDSTALHGHGSGADAPFFLDILYNIFVRRDCVYRYFVAQSTDSEDDIRAYVKCLLEANVSESLGIDADQVLSPEERITRLKSNLRIYMVNKTSVYANAAILAGGPATLAFIMPSAELSSLFVRLEGQAVSRLNEVTKLWSKEAAEDLATYIPD